MTRDTLKMYALYYKPSDYPDHYVLRGVTINPGYTVFDKEPLMVEKEVEKIHEEMQKKGLIFLLRDEGDEPQILGSYI